MEAMFQECAKILGVPRTGRSLRDVILLGRWFFEFRGTRERAKPQTTELQQRTPTVIHLKAPKDFIFGGGDQEGT
jgi:hypothetical protein